MKRYPIVIGGTAAGLGLVLSFHTSSPKLTHLSTGTGAAGTTAPGVAPTTVPSSGAPVTTAPATNAPATNAPATTAPATTAPATTRSATGQDIQYRYGDIQLKVTEQGRRITDVQVVQESATDPRSEAINSQAVPLLQQQTMSAQSANIDGVSGATFTSEAFYQSLQSALAQLGQ